MATIKSYTTIEQSRKLAEFLPLENADQTWIRIAIAGANLDVPEELQYRHNGDIPFQYYSGIGIPCWSLSALLNILVEQEFIIKSLERNNEYQYNIDIPSRHCKIWFSSLLDAVFEMICWLKENNKI